MKRPDNNFRQRSAMPVKARGKILREPSQNPGIVMIQGQQFQFQREGVWRSETAPRAGLVVDVNLDNNLQVIGMSVVTDSEPMNDRQDPPALLKETTVKTRIGFVGKLLAILKGSSHESLA
jgi:hypothetical protein